MDQRKYYINVQARTINVVRNAAVVEWEIDGDASDVEYLQELFDDLAEADQSPLGQFFKLGIGSDTQENEAYYEELLNHIYKVIHRLSTPETRSQLEKTGVLVV